MTTTDVDKFIEHYGVMGMHWGVTNDPGEVRKSKKAKHLFKFDIHDYMEKQGRKKLEQRYTALNSGDISRGQRFIRDNLFNITVGALTAIAVGGTAGYVMDTLDRKVPRSPFAYMMNLIIAPKFKLK